MMAVGRIIRTVGVSTFAAGLAVAAAQTVAWADAAEAGSAPAVTASRGSDTGDGPRSQSRAGRPGPAASAAAAARVPGSRGGSRGARSNAAAAPVPVVREPVEDLLPTRSSALADSPAAKPAISAPRSVPAGAATEDFPVSAGPAPAASAIVVKGATVAEPAPVTPVAAPAVAAVADAKVAAVVAALPQRLSPVAAVTAFLDSVGTWLSGLPASPVTGFLQGALLLIRRSLPGGGGAGGGGCTSSCPPTSAPGVRDAVVAGLREGKAVAVEPHLASTVDLRVGDFENIYSRAQATSILKDFFNRHPVQSFDVVHTSAARLGSQFLIGTLRATDGDYRVQVIQRQLNDVWVVTQLRIEPTD